MRAGRPKRGGLNLSWLALFIRLVSSPPWTCPMQTGLATVIHLLICGLFLFILLDSVLDAIISSTKPSLIHHTDLQEESWHPTQEIPQNTKFTLIKMLEEPLTQTTCPSQTWQELYAWVILQQEVLVKHPELTGYHQSEKFGEGQKVRGDVSPYVLPTSQNSSP